MEALPFGLGVSGRGKTTMYHSRLCLKPRSAVEISRVDAENSKVIYYLFRGERIR